MNKIYSYFKNIGMATSITWLIAALILGIFTAVTYGGATNSIGFEILLITSNILAITSIAIYNVNLVQSLGLFMLSEVAIFIGAMLNGESGSYLELAISIIAFLVIAIRAIKIVQKDKNISNRILIRLLKIRIEPFNISAINKIILYSLITSFVFIQAKQNMIDIGINFIGTAYMVLPLVILLMLVVGIHDVQYIRLIYYISWVMILNQAKSIMLIPSTQIIEPMLYIIVILVSEFEYIKRKN